MENRVFFSSIKQRDLFFEKVLRAHDFIFWNQLAEEFNIRRTLLENYRNGKTSLPESLYNQFFGSLSEFEKEEFKDSVSLKSGNWGRSKGGVVTYSKHKDIFNNGRMKGLLKINSGRSKNEIDINLPLDENLAYFVGLYIGDGFSGKYGRSYMTQFIGHRIDEGEFYRKTFSKISKELFGLVPYIKEDEKANALRINFYSKSLFFLLTDRFKIKSGRKSRVVLIPDEILNSSSKIILSCIAGLYDAEGCYFVDKRKSYRKGYPRFDIHMSNPSIIQQISDTLNKHSISHWGNNVGDRIVIYGDKKIRTFFNKVPIKNPKHLLKINR